MARPRGMEEACKSLEITFRYLKQTVISQSNQNLYTPITTVFSPRLSRVNFADVKSVKKAPGKTCA